MSRRFTKIDQTALEVNSVLRPHNERVCSNHLRIPVLLQMSMTDPIESLGMIAGNRSLPLLFAQQARSMGVKRLVAAAFEGETDLALKPLVDEIVWLKVGQLSKLISVFTQRGIKQC